MKILIIGFAKIKYQPYLNFYYEPINKEMNEVHILYWNRDMQKENLEKYHDCVFHEFKCYQKDMVPKLTKIRNFRKFSRYATKIIENENFDFIFVLGSNVGIVLRKILWTKYKEKYIFDYRDATYEKYSIFKKNIANLVQYSYATFVSSDAFRTLLPSVYTNKIYTTHNLLMDSLNHRYEKIQKEISSDKIRIAFWGMLREETINKEIIKKIAQDSRFELHYYGREEKVTIALKSFAEKIKASNVFFHGEYVPEDRYLFVRQTDLIHNIYCHSNAMLAMTNKYYDGIIFNIPQLCMEGSYMGKRASVNQVGFSCNPFRETFLNEIYEYYCSIHKSDFYKACDSELTKIMKEYNAGCEVIKKITNS